MPESPIASVSKLGKWGLVGVMLALISSNVIAVYLVYLLAVNHITQSNTVMTKLEIAVTELSTIIRLPNKISMK